jgi:threonine dehydratase
MLHYVRKILEARVYDVARITPLDEMQRLSARLDARILLKREDLQPTFSFKIRGAYNRMTRMGVAERAAGAICASAGNHAQGVALAGCRLGMRAVIVMPVTTPSIKVDSVRSLGGEIILFGDTFDEAQAHAVLLAAREGLCFIHPYDDPEVIAGQGTVGMEIFQQHPDPIEAIFVPVGGGGLAAGIAAYAKYLRPETRVFGVEPEDAASMKRSIEANERIMLDRVGLFADGAAVRQPGEETFALCRDLLDGVITVGTDGMCAAIKDVFEDTRVLLEAAGALSLAGAKRYLAQGGPRTGSIVAVASGANMNFDRLRHVAERAEVGEDREILLGVTIAERPGSYRTFIGMLGNRPVTEFNYRYGDPDRAHIFIGLKVEGGAAERAELLMIVRAHGLQVLDMSANELAKSHIRHMIGGTAPGLPDEIIMRCIFPERTGALLRFLEAVGSEWNISLFHYRNHGADYGRILAGVQVPPAQRARFRTKLDELGYEWSDETDNPAYLLFLHKEGIGDPAVARAACAPSARAHVGDEI